MNQFKIPGFEMIEELGTGGMASVWKARQVSLDRTVAIKFLSSGLSRDADSIDRFRQEAQAAAKLKHPGIVQVHDAHAEHGLYYFVMEHVAGYTVGEWLRRKKKLPEKDALLVAECVADALQYAWETANIIHCDIKPDNVMVDADGTVKLADLGLARTLSAMGATQASEEVLGTPQYISPEQALGEPDLDFRTDIYSLGAMLYHLVTGKMPFEGEPPEVIMQKQVSDTLPDPIEVSPDLSNGMCWLIEKMMAKDRSLREKDWSSVRNDIIRVKKRLRPAGEPLPEGASTVRRHPRRLKAERAASHAQSTKIVSQRTSMWPRIVAIAVLGVAVLLYVQIKNGSIRLRTLPGDGTPAPLPVPAEDKTGVQETIERETAAEVEEAARALYDKTIQWIDENPDKYDEIIAMLGKVLEETGGTHYESMAEVQLRRYKLARFNKVKAVMSKLQSDTAYLVEASQYAEAAEQYEAYEGRLAAETADARREMVENLRRREADAEAAERNRLRQAEKRTQRLMASVASSVLDGRFDDAIKAIDVALGDPSNCAHGDEVKRVRDLVEKTALIENRVLKSFADQVGQGPIAVRFPGGSMDLTVEKVEGNTVRCTKKRVVGSAVASSALHFKVADLAPSERLNRMGDAEEHPDVALMKGLMAYEAGADSHARKYFDLVDPFLGKELKACLDSREAREEPPPPPDPVEEPPGHEEELEPPKALKPLPSDERRGTVTDLVRREYGDVLGNGDAIVRILCEKNDGLRKDDVEFRRARRERGGEQVVTDLTIISPAVADLGPVAALPDLAYFRCSPIRHVGGKHNNAGNLKDLRPLSNLALRRVSIENCHLQDLFPLKNMNLRQASFAHTDVRDISALRGMPLEWLDLSGTKVTEISALAGMPLITLKLNDVAVRNLSHIKGLPSIKELQMNGGRATSIGFLAGLKLERLNLAGNMIRDISVLKGMPLKSLNLAGVPITDMSALEGLPIETLDLGDTKIKDFTAIRSLPLKVLRLSGARVEDLWMLKDMPLHTLDISKTGVKALWPLKSLPIKDLNIEHTKIADLSVLAGLPLKTLRCRGVLAKDFSVLRGLPIEVLWIDKPKSKSWLNRALPDLRVINGMKPDKMW